MRKIKLHPNEYVIVDDADYEYMSQWKWRLHKDGYAYRTGKPNVYMHRLINKTPQGMITDHINRNKLDNRRANLRTVVKAENQRNTKIFATNTSGYKGVSWSKVMNMWQAYIFKNNKKINLGYFEDVKKAAKARQLGEGVHW